MRLIKFYPLKHNLISIEAHGGQIVPSCLYSLTLLVCLARQLFTMIIFYGIFIENISTLNLVSEVSSSCFVFKSFQTMLITDVLMKDFSFSPLLPTLQSKQQKTKGFALTHPSAAFFYDGIHKL